MNQQFTYLFSGNRLLWHIAFWLCIWIFFGIVWEEGPGKNYYIRSFAYEGFFLPGRMLMTYWTLYFLLPNFLLKRRIAAFIIVFIISLTLSGLLEQAILVSLFHPKFSTVNKGNVVYWNINTIVRIILIINSTVIVAATIKVIKYWYQNQQRLQHAEREQLVSEIKYLQTQIQPHFFFNTL